MRRCRNVLGVIIAAWFCGCSGGSSPAPAAKAPQSQKMFLDSSAPVSAEKSAGAPAVQGLEPTAPSAESAAVPQAAPPAAAPGSYDRSAAPEAGDPRARYARANVQLSDARRQLDVAAGARDCANACRALESMERAAQQVCELARSPEERRACRSADEQVGAAREKVRNACGGCSQKP